MTIHETADYLKKHDDFIITTHTAPDADGLGAQYALLAGLLKLGKRARAVNADPYSAKYSFIDARHTIEALRPDSFDGLDLSAHTVILVDTNDIHFAGDMAEVAEDKAGAWMILDHHELRGSDHALACCLPGMSSTCEMVHGILAAMGVKVGIDAANALFTGMVYDTGSFSYAKTGAGTFKVALALVEDGVDPAFIHNALYESSSVGALLLRKEVLSSLELFAGDSIAVQTMTRQTLERSGALYEDSEDLINLPLQCSSVQVSILLKEDGGGTLRCSLRSKGRVNVAQVAQSFGGGGHRTAAGFRSPLALDELKRTMVESCSQLLAGY